MKRSECYLDCGGNSGVVDLPKTIFRLMGTPSCDPLVAGAQSASVASVSTAAPLPQRPDCDATPLHFLDTNGRAGEFGDDGQMEDELFSQFSDTVSGDAASGTDQFFWSGDESGTETASAEVDGDHEVHAHKSPAARPACSNSQFHDRVWASLECRGSSPEADHVRS